MHEELLQELKYSDKSSKSSDDESNEDAPENHIGTQKIVMAASKEILDQQLAFETKL